MGNAPTWSSFGQFELTIFTPFSTIKSSADIQSDLVGRRRLLLFVSAAGDVHATIRTIPLFLECFDAEFTLEVRVESVGSFEAAYEVSSPDIIVDVSSVTWSHTLHLSGDPDWADRSDVTEMVGRMILFAQTHELNDHVAMIGRGNRVLVSITDREGRRDFLVDSWAKRALVCEIIDRDLDALQNVCDSSSEFSLVI